MTLRMAQPRVNPNTKVIYLRQRTPEDMQHLVGTKVRLPVGSLMKFATIHRHVVQISLGTKNLDEGKLRHAEADAALRAFWASKRRERELAFEVGQVPPPSMSWSRAVERFGPSASTVLRQQGIADTDANRAAIIAETASVFDAVARKLDPATGRAMVDGVAHAQQSMSNTVEGSGGNPATTPTQISVDDLWKRFVAAKSGVLASKTISRYSSALISLDGFCRDRDIRHVTDDDIFAWAEHRRDEDDIKPRVINRNDLAAVRSVFGWAITHQGRKLLSANPARGIRLDEPRHVILREKSFREAEIRTILSAATNVEIGGNNPTLSRAKRWCPWLAAYSGARIAELTALETGDIWQEHGAWVMHFDQTKTRMPRTIPIHNHLIEQGFLEVVQKLGDGPLFYDPTRMRKPNAKSAPWQHRAQEMATWVRETAKLDPEVDPNHGWRHTFKSRALEIIDMRIRDHIVGHIPTTPARKYEHPPIEKLAAAMARFPRYSLTN